MYSKQRASSSWWLALWIYVVTFFLVTLTFFQAANAGEKKPTETKGNKGMFVEFETTEGTFKIKLNADKAPKSVENFLKYVDSDFYKGTIFHRVIPGFMVQGGGMTADMNQKPTQAPVQNEADNGLKNKRGTLAMARTNDPHSATAQFFVNLVDNGFLDYTSKSPSGWGYAVFGEVIEGMDVIDAMTKIPTGDKGYHQNVPKKVIEIKSTKRVEK